MRTGGLLLFWTSFCAASEAACLDHVSFVHDGTPREVKVFTPRCDEGDRAFPNNSLPLLFAVHCFGCTYRQMEHWAAEARAFNFVLVLPLESKPGAGFNAVSCCGEAARSNVDDIGFLRAAAERVAARVREAAHPPVAYGIGWSNGGFLVALDALDAAASGAPRLFRAIAPISGYQYSVDAVARLEPPLPVLLHHGIDDRNVRFDGCCDRLASPASGGSSARPCCCGIGKGATECVGVRDVIGAGYRAANRCAGEMSDTAIADLDAPRRRASAGDIRAPRTLRAGGGARTRASGAAVKPHHSARCQSLSGCAANTTVCVHGRGAGHLNSPSHDIAFDRGHREEIARFFARDACALGGGVWSDGACDCNEERGGPYCGVLSR
jgi:poly(3-hydroxybutyrate) depolymerase